MARPLLAALLLALAALPAAAQQRTHAQEHPLWIVPERRGEAIFGVLTLPEGWSVGDAAVLLLAGAGDMPQAGPIRHALVEEGAAVLSIEPARLGSASCGRGALPGLRGAVTALRVTLGAGLLVGIGTDCVTAALVAEAPEAFAAVIASDGDGLAFIPGLVPPPAEGWPLRAAILCERIGAATARDETVRECRDALAVPEVAATR